MKANKSKINTIVVTRHPAMMAYLLEQGYIRYGEFNLIPHVSPNMVEGMHVIGNVPMHVAAAALDVTTIPLNLPFEARGRELTLQEIRKCAGTPRTYVVKEV